MIHCPILTISLCTLQNVGRERVVLRLGTSDAYPHQCVLFSVLARSSYLPDVKMFLKAFLIYENVSIDICVFIIL